MNIIEAVKEAVQSFPQIAQVCSDIHVDFTDSEPTNYGISSNGDKSVRQYINGDEVREHQFVLYAVYQSMNDYDRIVNSGLLLELQQYLEQYANGQPVESADKTGELVRLRCANGMLYEIPNGDINHAVMYQIQITAKYNLYKGEFKHD